MHLRAFHYGEEYSLSHSPSFPANGSNMQSTLFAHHTEPSHVIRPLACQIREGKYLDLIDFDTLKITHQHTDSSEGGLAGSKAQYHNNQKSIRKLEKERTRRAAIFRVKHRGEAGQIITDKFNAEREGRGKDFFFIKKSQLRRIFQPRWCYKLLEQICVKEFYMCVPTHLWAAVFKQSARPNTKAGREGWKEPKRKEREEIEIYVKQNY